MGRSPHAGGRGAPLSARACFPASRRRPGARTSQRGVALPQRPLVTAPGLEEIRFHVERRPVQVTAPLARPFLDQPVNLRIHQLDRQQAAPAPRAASTARRPARAPTRRLTSTPSIRPSDKSSHDPQRFAPSRIMASRRAARNDRPRPSRKIASSKLVLPEAFFPGHRLIPGAGLQLSVSKQRSPVIESGFSAPCGCATAASASRRTCSPALRVLDQAAARRIPEFQSDGLRIQGAQRRNQVLDVEADFHRGALVLHLDLLLGLFLLRIVRLDGDAARLQRRPERPCTSRWRESGCDSGHRPAAHDPPASAPRFLWNHALVVREPAVDQLGGQGGCRPATRR
jgi:hypothetical protein